jgi:hypothetical protein
VSQALTGSLSAMSVTNFVDGRKQSFFSSSQAPLETLVGGCDTVYFLNLFVVLWLNGFFMDVSRPRSKLRDYMHIQ